jgi:hypothetical protein
MTNAARSRHRAFTPSVPPRSRPDRDTTVVGCLSGWQSGVAADGGPSGRLAGLTVALSLAPHLGTGQPTEHGRRTCSLRCVAAGTDH